mgnify:CR=1 FL=1
MSDKDASNNTPHNMPHSMPRRDALKAMAAVAVVPMLPERVANVAAAPAPAVARTPLPVLGLAPAKGPRGTPSDPDLINAKVTWEMTLEKSELVTLAALCDMIIPADDKSPSASSVGAHDYINEWASRPGGDASLVRIRGGLIWIDRESMTRFSKPFHQATDAQRAAICDDICFLPNARPAHRFAAQFFDTVRDQTATAFYTTPDGWKDLGYIGNVPLIKFEGPSLEIRKQIGLV